MGQVIHPLGGQRAGLHIQVNRGCGISHALQMFKNRHLLCLYLPSLNRQQTSGKAIAWAGAAGGGGGIWACGCHL